MQWTLNSIAAVSSLLSGQCSSIGGQLCDYHFIGENMTWKAAKDYCRKNHTDLATVSNQTDMQRLLNSTTEQYQGGAWIGLQNNTTNTVWSWSDGSNFSFRLWDKEEPDDDDSEKTCAMTTSDGKWSSDDCNKTKPFFCYNGEFSRSLSNGTVHLHLFNDLLYLLVYYKNYGRLARGGVNQSGDWLTPPLIDSPSPLRDSVILIKKNMTWVDALYYCRDHYSDLVSITNMEEQLWVQERAKMASTPYVWLGLRYTCTLDLWFWVTDEMVCYNNWGPGQPGDNCTTAGAMDREGTWVKKDDHNQLNFICSK
uniref:C-type lectin domain-containing protein n=1 Tax=Sander lucioperca TaxID=283035 RepID=A0A8C9ZM90_SANLU